MTAEERDLLVRAAAGDPAAVNAVAAAYGRFVNRVCWRIVRNSADAADITQDVLLKAVGSLHALETVEAFRTWLYRIAYRASLNWLRRNGKLATDDGADIEALPASDPEEAQADEERLARVAELAGNLPPPYRLVVKMFYFEERSCREIAAILGETEGTVKVRLHRARELLRNAWKSSDQ